MTDQQQRNADIARSVEHALNQASIDAREWERQAGQWEGVVIAQRGEISRLERQCAELTQALEAAENTISRLAKTVGQQEERYELAMLQIRDAHNALHAAGVPCEKHEAHEGCTTQLGHRVRDLAEHARKVDEVNDAMLFNQVKLDRQLSETYAHWREARSAELLLVRNDLEETRRVNRRLLEDQHNLLGRLHAVESECAAALEERDEWKYLAMLEGAYVGAAQKSTPRVSSSREALAAYAHEAWAAYMDYFLKKCQPLITGGDLIIPAAYVAALRNLITTPYDALPNEQKALDRAEADKILALLALSAPPPTLAATPTETGGGE